MSSEPGRWSRLQCKEATRPEIMSKIGSRDLDAAHEIYPVRFSMYLPVSRCAHVGVRRFLCGGVPFYHISTISLAAGESGMKNRQALRALCW